MRTNTIILAAILLVAAAPSATLADPFAYVTSTDYYLFRKVSVLDAATDAIVAEIPTKEDNPEGIAITPNGTTAYVASNTASMGDDAILVIDTAAREIVDRIPLGPRRWPKGMAITPAGAYVYVASDSVAVIDTSTNAVTDTIAVGGRARAVAISRDGTRAYVASPRDFPEAGILSVIDTKTRTVIGAIVIKHGPWDVAVTPDGSRVYLTDYYSVTVIDAKTAEVAATIPVSGGLITAIVITPDGTRAYVAGYTGIVSVIDTKTNTVVGTISAVVHEPHAMAMTADGTRVYVGGYLGDIAVIDTASNTIVDRTGVSVTATAIAIGP